MSGNERNDELGLLIIVVLKAQNLPDLHKYSKCNPYCVVSVSKDNKGQTIVDRGGGQFPLWDDEVRLTLSRHDSTKLVVKVLSQEQSGEDDVLLGTGTAELGDPSKWPNHQFDDWVLLSIGDEQQGEVYLEMTFYPAEHIKSSKGSDLVRKPSSVPAMERLSRVPQSLRPASGVNQKSATTGSHLPRYQLPLPGEPDDVAREGLAPVPTTWPPPAHNVLGAPNLTYPPPTLGIATPAAAAGGHLNVAPTFGHAISASPAPSPGLTPVSASSLGSPFLHNLSTDSRPASIGPPSGAHSLSRSSLELPPSAVANQTSFAAPDAPPPIPPRPDSSLAARTNSPIAYSSRPSSSDGGLQAPSPRQRRPLPSPPSPAATSNNAVPIDKGKGKAKEDAVPEETYARRKEREEEEERLKMERSVLAAEQRAIEEQLEQERRDAQMAAALSERMALDERIARAKQEQNRKQDEQKDAEIVRLLMLEEEREAKEQEERIKEDERIAKELADRERKQASEPKKLVKQVIDSKSDSKAPQQHKPKPSSKKEPASSSKASAKASDSAPVKSENGGQGPSARSGLFSGWGKKSKGQ